MKRALLFIIPALLLMCLTVWFIHEQKDAATWLLQLAMLLGVVGVGASCVMERMELNAYYAEDDEFEEDTQIMKRR